MNHDNAIHIARIARHSAFTEYRLSSALQIDNVCELTLIAVCIDGNASNEAYDGKVKGRGATFPEILRHTPSVGGYAAVPAAARLMFHRHELCEFEGKRRVTDS